MNLWDILLILALAFAAGLALRRLIKNKKAGRCSCGDCSACGKCPVKSREKED